VYVKVFFPIHLLALNFVLRFVTLFLGATIQVCCKICLAFFFPFM
jgi:hypothetical protein